MRPKLLGLGHFLDHFLPDNATKYCDDSDHERNVAEADEGEDWTVPEGDTETTDEHGDSVDKLSDFLTDALTYHLEVL